MTRPTVDTHLDTRVDTHTVVSTPPPPPATRRVDARPPVSTPTPARPVRVLLPVAPLAEAISSAARRRTDRFGIVQDDSPCRLFGCPPSAHTTRHRKFLAARTHGHVPLTLAEDICDDVLGQHARMLYGDAWDDAAEHAARLANTRVGGGPGEWVARVLAELHASEQTLTRLGGAA